MDVGSFLESPVVLFRPISKDPYHSGVARNAGSSIWALSPRRRDPMGGGPTGLGADSQIRDPALLPQLMRSRKRESSGSKYLNMRYLSRTSTTIPNIEILHTHMLVLWKGA